MKKTLLVVALLFPFVSFASVDTNLKYGSRGNEVIELQEFLISKGFLVGEATGNFFSLTRAAVIRYQVANQIEPAVGYVGTLTRSKINSELAAEDAAGIGAEMADTGTVTPPKQDAQIDLLKQQNLLLQQQLQAQQQTAQNTTPPPPAKKKPTSAIYAKVNLSYRASEGKITVQISDVPFISPLTYTVFSSTNGVRGPVLTGGVKDTNCETKYQDGIKRCFSVQEFTDVPLVPDGTIYVVESTFNNYVDSASARAILDQPSTGSAMFIYSDMEF